MLPVRIFPCLLLRGEGLYKTYKFKKPTYVGDPVNVIKIFNEKEVDELCILDIECSEAGREPNFSLIEEIAGECFMPLTYGGGIKSIDQAERLFRCGVEKIVVQSAVFERPDLVGALAARFGSQSIVVSVDLKRNFFRKLKCYDYRDKSFHDGEVLDWMRNFFAWCR